VTDDFQNTRRAKIGNKKFLPCQHQRDNFPLDLTERVSSYAQHYLKNNNTNASMSQQITALNLFINFLKILGENICYKGIIADTIRF
jgi:hypothetical protein